MSSEPLLSRSNAAATPTPEIIAAAAPPRPTIDLWLETGVVLLLGVIPYLFVSLSSIALPQVADQGTFEFMCCNLLMHSFQVSVPVLYLIWRSGEPMVGFGLSRPRLLADPAAGVAIYVAGLLAWTLAIPVYTAIAGANVQAGQADRLFEAPRAVPMHYLLLVAASCANAFSEELVVRAYLIPRFERLLGSTWLSLMVTTGLFSAYHIYQGAAGALGAAVLGMVYGLSFCYSRRLWPVFVAHAIQDVTGLMQVAG